MMRWRMNCARRRESLRHPDNLLSGWRSEAEPQEVADDARTSR